MYLPQPTEGNFEPAPEGAFPAVCYRLIDLGTQQVTYQGQSKTVRQLYLSWELHGEGAQTEDGKPFTISKRYTFSMHEKATLRRHLESWRGKRFVDSDFGEGGFDLRNVLGAPCLLTIVHKDREGKTYANIEAVSKLVAGMQKPEPVNDPQYLSLERDRFEKLTLGELPDWLQDTIKQSPEYIEAAGGQRPAQNGGYDNAPLDDDIPF